MNDMLQTMRWAHPVRDLMNVQRQIDRFLDEWPTRDAHGASGSGMTRAVQCELAESDKNYDVWAELPGIPKDAIKVEVDDNVLTISAERKEEKRDAATKRHISELHYGLFQRSFELPTAVDAERVQATFENGVLHVSVPKKEVAAKSRRIPIR